MSQPQKQETTSQIFTGTQGIIDDSQLDKKDKRIRKAVRLYYGDNEYNTQAEVAEEMNITRRTVAKYLDSDRAKAFERFFSDKEKHEIDRWLQEQLASHYDKALDGLAEAHKRAKGNPEISPQILTNTSLGILKADQRFVELMQELGVKKKPKERKEVQETSGEITFNEEIVTKDDDKEVEEDATTD